MRVIDFFLSLLLLILSIPLILFIIFLLFFSQNNIFYFSERIGKNGKKFYLLKFSTIKKKNSNPSKEEFSRFGKFLRRSSFDEIPQLLNVLIGDMSLVGPRPLPENIEKKIPNKLKIIRRSVFPGITGNSQINYKGIKRSLIEKVNEDLVYIRNKNFLNYFKILCITPFYIIIKYNKNKSGYSL